MRAKLYAVVREVACGKEQYLVTPGDEDAVVMLSRRDYNDLVAERDLLRDLRYAEADIGAGRLHSSTEVRAFLATRGGGRTAKVGKTAKARRKR